MTAGSPLMQLTRIDGSKVTIVKAQIVSWSDSARSKAQCITFTNGRLQDVTETADEISALFTKGI